MAIALDTSADLGSTTATTLTASYTNNAGNILFVGVIGDSSDTITGVTYNGVSLTLLEKNISQAGDRYCYLFYLLNPATGAHNVVVSNSANDFMEAVAATYTGANVGIDTHGNAIGNSTSITKSLTTANSGDWAVGMIKGANAISASQGVIRVSTAFSSIGLMDSNGSVGGVGVSATLTATQTSGVWVICMAIFSPVQTASTNGSFLQNFV